MTIKLYQAVNFAGTPSPAGSVVSVGASAESDLVQRGLAEYYESAIVAYGSPRAIAPVDAVWADRAALVTQGLLSAFFTDVGVGGGSLWYYRGGRWRPFGGSVRLKSLTTDVSNNGAPKIVLEYATIPAGLWQDGDLLTVELTKERTGGTSDTDATDILLGTAPTTLGTTLNLNTSGLATTNISMSTRYRWRRLSATSVRAQAIGGTSGLGNSSSANSTITGLSNLDSIQTYIQVSSDLTTAGGEVVWLRGFEVELQVGA